MDFDKHINRQNYPAQKWRSDDLLQHFGSDDLLPLWIADMDFQAPPVVIEQLMARAEHGIYGYEYRSDSFFQAIEEWYKTRHDWVLNREHIEASPGVLSAMSIIISQHSNEGDGIIVQPPVFFEFRQIIRKGKREIVKNPLILSDGHYQIDFDDLAAKAADPRNKLMILCNPHNPVGRVWRREELEQIHDICQKNNVLIISDEVHGDIVYKPHRYIPFSSLSESAAQGSFTCLSPAKTFNIAGMIDAMVVIPNEAYRQKYDQFADQFQINRTNVFASVAMEAGYRYGADWLEQLLTYLQGNVSYMQDYLAQHIPQVKLIEPEGTYLVWLDFTELGLEAKELDKFLAQKARLALNSGYWFGREGAGFARMNIAVPHSILDEALSRLRQACT